MNEQEERVALWERLDAWGQSCGLLCNTAGSWSLHSVTPPCRVSGECGVCPKFSSSPGRPTGANHRAPLLQLRSPTRRRPICLGRVTHLGSPLPNSPPCPACPAGSASPPPPHLPPISHLVPPRLSRATPSGIFPPWGGKCAGQSSGDGGRGAPPRARARPRPSLSVTQPRGCRGTQVRGASESRGSRWVLGDRTLP